MKLAVSNIAWSRNEDSSVYHLLREEGAGLLEIAPSRIWDAPYETNESDWLAARTEIEEGGFQIVGMQALLFGKPELQIFGTDGERDATLDYLSHLFRMAKVLSGCNLVFGSPQNRKRGEIAFDKAVDIASEFFRTAATQAARRGVVLCLEPNPPQYNCDFIHTVAEAAELVRKVDHEGFRMNLDTSSLILNEEEIEQTIEGAADVIQHVHVSEPYLAGIGSYVPVHRKVAAALRQVAYRNAVSIEMRRPQEDEATERVLRQAVRLTREIYAV